MTALRVAAARKLAELRGHRDLEHEIVLDGGTCVPVWKVYLSDADTILALAARVQADAAVIAGLREEVANTRYVADQLDVMAYKLDAYGDSAAVLVKSIVNMIRDALSPHPVSGEPS